MTQEQIAAAIRAVAAMLQSLDVIEWATELMEPMAQAEINTPHRAAMFLGHAAAESGFRNLTENLNYTAERLVQVWPNRFPDLTAALPYAQNPPRLANQVYSNRLGNGPPVTGDGWTFRGRGLFQLTGRYTYGEFARAVGQPLAVATVWCATKPGAAASACWFWEEHDLNTLADGWEITRSTKVITGSTASAPKRIKLCNAALVAIGSVAAGGPSVPAVVPVPAPPQPSADDLNLKELDRILKGLPGGSPSPVIPDNSSDVLNQAEIDKIERE